MAVSLKRIKNPGLEFILRRFHQDTPVAAHKHVQIVTDTTDDWAVHVAPVVDNAFRLAVLSYYGNGKYDRRWTSAGTGNPDWNLYCSYEDSVGTPNHADAPWDISVVVYAMTNITGDSLASPMQIATVRLYNVIGMAEADTCLQEYKEDNIPPAERKAIDMLLAMLRFTYPFTTLKWEVIKTLAPL